MSVADRLNKLSTDITNAYTSIENKGGTIPANKNTNNLSTAINSIEVIEQATAEGESLSLTNTKAMPYKNYVVEGKSEQNGEPSPSNPSEIHSVADDVNLWDGEIVSSINATYSNGVVTQTTADTSTERSWKFNAYNNDSFIKNIGKVYKTDLGIVSSSFTKESSFNVLSFGLNGLARDTMITISLSNLKDDETYTLSFNVTNVTQGSISWQDIKIQKGTTATPYSPYNQGTVTIKQRGKNLFDKSKISSSITEYTITIQDGGFVINTGGLSNGGSLGLLKDLCPNLKVGDKFKFTWDSNATRNGLNVTYVYLQGYNQTILKDTLYTCTQTMLDSNVYFYGQQGEYYKDIIFYLDGQTSDYEPYQGNDYTFQTEPLRSLPNGVKDTIEAEQHRKIGKQTGTLTETTTITLSDAKTNGAYMCNIKPSGTLTGKTIELEAGDYEIIYELEEEIIEPLTQNQATTMLDIIKTGSYEGTTNIYTDEDVKPTMKVGYYKKG